MACDWHQVIGALLLLISVAMTCGGCGGRQEGVDVCGDNHVASACLLNGSPDLDCCGPPEKKAGDGGTSCAGDHEQHRGRQGCGGDSLHLVIFGSWHDKPENFETCCFPPPSPVPIILGVLGGTCGLSAIIAFLVICCKKGWCQEHPQQVVAPPPMLANTVSVMVPQGVFAGQNLKVPTPYGTEMIVTVPAGYGPGMSFVAAVPPQPTAVAAPAILQGQGSPVVVATGTPVTADCGPATVVAPVTNEPTNAVVVGASTA